MAVIGLDFGDHKSFPCFIEGFNEKTRMGGLVHDLLPLGQSDGIPSVYFYSERVGELVGENAVRQRASQMPMVEKQVETYFPQYKDKIKIYRPSRAIAYGTARYGPVTAGRDALPIPPPKGGNKI